jgi:hypothetical protein
MRATTNGSPAISEMSRVILERLIMIFSKITSDISEIAGDPAISEQSVKKIIIPALGHLSQYNFFLKKNIVLEFI